MLLIQRHCHKDGLYLHLLLYLSLVRMELGSHLLPDSFYLLALTYLISLVSLIFCYADKSPKTNHPDEVFIAVTTELVVLKLRPGVPTTELVEANDAPVPDSW